MPCAMSEVGRGIDWVYMDEITLVETSVMSSVVQLVEADAVTTGPWDEAMEEHSKPTKPDRSKSNPQSGVVSAPKLLEVALSLAVLKLPIVRGGKLLGFSVC